MIIDAGTEFDAVIGGEPCHIYVRSATMTMRRPVFDYIDGPEVIGPTSIELDVSMIVIPLDREDLVMQKEIVQPRLGIEKGS